MVNFLFAVENYDKLIAAFNGMLPSLGPQAKPYVEQLNIDVKKVKHAVEGGVSTEIVSTMGNFAKDTKAGAGHTRPVPALFHLIDAIVSEQLQYTWALVGVGERTSNDVTDLMGKLANMIEEATPKRA